MTAFVLVPGAWLGGWSWEQVARRLREHGHDAYPVTLTGLGERVHLASSEVNLDTHLTDVVNLIEYEDLRDVVLVGHSYAGIVVTGVADRIPERIGTVVYVEAGPAPDGMAFVDMSPPEAREHDLQQVKDVGDGWRLPVPTWEELETIHGASLDGLGEEERHRMRSGAVPHPFGTYTQPLRLTNPARERLPKVLISCSLPLDQVRQLIDGGHPWFKELGGPEWSLRDLPTGHWPMFSVPRELADVLRVLGST